VWWTKEEKAHFLSGLFLPGAFYSSFLPLIWWLTLERKGKKTSAGGLMAAGESGIY